MSDMRSATGCKLKKRCGAEEELNRDDAVESGEWRVESKTDRWASPFNPGQVLVSGDLSTLNHRSSSRLTADGLRLLARACQRRRAAQLSAPRMSNAVKIYDTTLRDGTQGE